MEPLRNATKKQIDEAIVENFQVSWMEILSIFNYPQPYDLFSVQGFTSGIGYMMMNALFDAYPGITTEKINEILNYHKSKKLPFMWFVTPIGQQYGLDKLLEEVGLELATMKVPGMVVDLEVIEAQELLSKIRENELITIDPFNEEQISEYVRIFMKSFEVDPTIEEEMRSYASAFPTHPHSSHYFVNVDDKPVATASVVYESGVAGIYNVATLPSYQRKGLATMLMAKLMLEAKQKGYQYSILHSSERGKVVYERLGYQVSFWFKRYLLRPEVVNFQ